MPKIAKEQTRVTKTRIITFNFDFNEGESLSECFSVIAKTLQHHCSFEILDISMQWETGGNTLISAQIKLSGLSDTLDYNCEV